MKNPFKLDSQQLPCVYANRMRSGMEETPEKLRIFTLTITVFILGAWINVWSDQFLGTLDYYYCRQNLYLTVQFCCFDTLHSVVILAFRWGLKLIMSTAITIFISAFTLQFIAFVLNLYFGWFLWKQIMSLDMLDSFFALIKQRVEHIVNCEDPALLLYTLGVKLS